MPAAIGAALAPVLAPVFGAAAAAVGTALASVALTVGFSLLTRQQQEVPEADRRRELNFPDEIPVKRFGLGYGRAEGTPIPWPTKGEKAYAAWLMSSLPSSGPFTLLIEDREVPLQGDPYDFTGDGATAVSGNLYDDNIVRVWIGRGDQTSPPDRYLDRVPYDADDRPYGWRASDAATGCTILYIEMKVGGEEKIRDRWPSAIPNVALIGNWAPVWDPRDAAQDPDDDTTWAFSASSHLCALHALRMNPIAPYAVSGLDIPMWEAGADVDDQDVALKAGGTEKRYPCGGVLLFEGTELEDLVQPILDAAASRLTWVSGKLGVIPGAPKVELAPITDFIGEERGAVQFSKILPTEETATDIAVRYTPQARQFESLDLGAWPVPGIGARRPETKTLALDWCYQDAQVQRLRQIAARRMTYGRRLSGVCRPDVLRAATGSWVPVALPAPYASLMNATYEVETMEPAAAAAGDGASFSVPISLRETHADVYAWDETVDEVEIEHPPKPGDIDSDSIEAPFTVSVGYFDDDNGAFEIPSFTATIDFDVGYEVGQLRSIDYEYRQQASGPWISGPRQEIPPDAETLDIRFPAGFPTNEHQFRARMRTGAYGTVTEWVTVTGITTDMTLTVTDVTTSSGTATWTADTPSGSAFEGVRVYRANAGQDFVDAVAVTDVISLPRGETGETFEATGLTAGPAEFWVVVVTKTGDELPPLYTVSLTIPA